MALNLYNTLTRTVEELTPLDGETIRMYTCGPTIYGFAHIGNFRTFIFQDVLRRRIKSSGSPLLHVMNITDVDDKIIDNAKRRGVSITEYTSQYAKSFFQDMEILRLERPEVTPFATDHIDQMVNLIQKLLQRGHAYESKGSIYYRIKSFAGYGRLSRLDLSQAQDEAQIDFDEYPKENPRDFVLWKAKKEGEAHWETPLGPGRPGWHIECSAMSMEYLGESFDVHVGGIDLIFPHHENETAQSEGVTGKPFVRHWLHSEFLLVDGEKMSKSKGNQYTLRDLMERGCNPMAVRYLLQSVHYRKQLNFTFEGVKQSQAALDRVNDFLIRVWEVPDDYPENTQLVSRIERAGRDFEKGLDDDLNTSSALAALFELIKDVNPLLEQQQVGGANRDQIVRLFSDANGVLAVFEVGDRGAEDEKIKALIGEREESRRQKDYQRADEIRSELARRGITLEDTKEGTRWKSVS